MKKGMSKNISPGIQPDILCAFNAYTSKQKHITDIFISFNRYCNSCVDSNHSDSEVLYQEVCYRGETVGVGLHQLLCEPLYHWCDRARGCRTRGSSLGSNSVSGILGQGEWLTCYLTKNLAYDWFFKKQPFADTEITACKHCILVNNHVRKSVYT